MNPSARLPKGILATVVAVLAFSPILGAQGNRVLPLDMRVSGAQRVVVATARTVNASWRENQFGDRIIVSRILLDVEENLKGGATQTVWMELAGGTLDGRTLRVSDVPEFKPGERAVLMLDQTDTGVYLPHLRGQGILKLDDSDVVQGTSTRLDDIRRAVAALGR
jgi:hypothetical protein